MDSAAGFGGRAPLGWTVLTIAFARAGEPQGYYDSARGKTGQQLRVALHASSGAVRSSCLTTALPGPIPWTLKVPDEDPTERTTSSSSTPAARTPKPITLGLEPRAHVA